MALFVLGLITIASVAMSFAFSWFMVQSCRREYQAQGRAPREASDGLAAFANHALTEVGRLFPTAESYRSTYPDVPQTAASEPLISAPALPQRAQTKHSTTDTIDTLGT